MGDVAGRKEGSKKEVEIIEMRRVNGGGWRTDDVDNERAEGEEREGARARKRKKNEKEDRQNARVAMMMMIGKRKCKDEKIYSSKLSKNILKIYTILI